MLSLIFFILIGSICFAAAVGVVTARQPVHSALFLLTNFATLAVLYVTLEAQFLAAAQIIIYAGGIVILILFVIMLIGHDDSPTRAGYRSWTPLVGLALGVVLVGAISASLVNSFRDVEPNVVTLSGGIPEAVGVVLFTRYVLPLELAAVLLLVALLGALLLARRPVEDDEVETIDSGEAIQPISSTSS